MQLKFTNLWMFIKLIPAVLDKKKQGEKELENMIKDLKDKLDRYENEKKSVVKLEKAKREAVSSKHEQDKKDLEEKLEKFSQKVRARLFCHVSIKMHLI